MPNTIRNTLLAGLMLFAAAFQPLPAAETLAVVETERHPVRVVELAGDLEHPWSLAFLPGGDLLVTERPGRLWRFSPDGTRRTPIRGVPAVYASGQGGLLDLALDPEFESNRLLYFSYAAEGPGGANTRLARARLADERLEDVTVLFDAEPNHPGGRHFGGRIVLLADGTVALTLGDRGRQTPSQDLMDHSGSVVRVTRDGQVPPDNPFTGRSDVRAEIYSYGHRNPQGAALHPQTGVLWLQEHGPRGGDEVNIVQPGANYGWPLVSHGVNYSGTPVGTGQASAPGLTAPVHVWVPSIAPSGMAFYDGAAFAGWRGSLLIGALKDQLLTRLTLDGDRVTGEERFLQRAIGRIRDVRAGPDGLVYLLTDASNGRLVRLEPAD